MDAQTGEAPQKKSGSKYLYEPFQPNQDNASLHRFETIEQVQQERWKALDYRLEQIEAKLERVERRVWLTIFGVAAVVLEDTVLAVLSP